MLANLPNVSNKDILKLVDLYPTVNITQRFKDRDYAIEIPETIIEQVTQFCEQRNVQLIPYPKAGEAKDT